MFLSFKWMLNAFITKGSNSSKIYNVTYVILLVELAIRTVSSLAHIQLNLKSNQVGPNLYRTAILSIQPNLISDQRANGPAHPYVQTTPKTPTKTIRPPSAIGVKVKQLWNASIIISAIANKKKHHFLFSESLIPSWGLGKSWM